MRVLTYNFYGKNHQTFVDSLAVAGVDGTLDDRFRGSDLRRRVFGKSGFVEGVSSLSGYLPPAMAVVCLLNPDERHSAPEQLRDKILQERIIKAVDASASPPPTRRLDEGRLAFLSD